MYLNGSNPVNLIYVGNDAVGELAIVATIEMILLAAYVRT